MPHDIIDNRDRRLLDAILAALPTSERARFAVGYLFLSGLKPLREQLEHLGELRLLIGATTDRETIETLAEGYRRAEPVVEEAERRRYAPRQAQAAAAQATRENLADALALMDQTDDDAALIETLLRLIAEGRIRVRVYTRGRLHAKAYIFDYGPVYDASGAVAPRLEQGLAIVGSSNLTLAGIAANAELNVIVHGNDNHAALGAWFDALWAEAQEFDAALMEELRRSWAGGGAGAGPEQITPYDIYLKALYELVRDRLEPGAEGAEVLVEDDITRQLADFQRAAVRTAIGMVRDYGGCFVADVVGLGKSFVGAAIVKHLAEADRARPLILCPASLAPMWERYNEVYQLHARVLSLGHLRESESGNILLDDPLYRDRDLVLLDESHNLRHSDTQRYRVLSEFMRVGKRCVLLTATPRDRSAADIHNQLKLFHPSDLTTLPIDPPSLSAFFKGVEKGERRLQDLLRHVLIRRTRAHILKWYGYDAETHRPVVEADWPAYAEGRRRAYIRVGGQARFFPRRQLETVSYSIDDTYSGLYQRLRRYLGKPTANQLEPGPEALTYARYGLWHYVRPELRQCTPYADLHRAGVNLRGLMRIMLFKRFESSVHAFRETLRKLHRVHTDFIAALDEGLAPVGEEAQALLYESDEWEEADLLDALRAASGRYRLQDFDADRLRQHIAQDARLLGEMLELVEPITPEDDDKLLALRALLARPDVAEGKRLIFTQYADTARYLFEALNPNGQRADIDVVYASSKSRERLVGRFAPRANPWYRPTPGEHELHTVIATDVLSEGLNLQDCDKVINYDLQWSPVRLIQRFGRVDRIGSEHERVYAYNFMPEAALERELGLRDKLARRIAEIHETIGEDAAVLDPAERLNVEAMYAIYERRGEGLGAYEEQGEEPFDLNEAEQIMRQLRDEQPSTFARVAGLADGVRSARAAAGGRMFAFFRAGRYQRLALYDAEGNALTHDLGEALRAIVCGPEEPALPLPPGYNTALMRAKTRFDQEVRQRQAQQRGMEALTQGQRYVLRELRALYAAAPDDETRGELEALDEAFRQTLPAGAQREVNRLRQKGLTGAALRGELNRIYHRYTLRERAARTQPEENDYPRIICSEALM